MTADLIVHRTGPGVTVQDQGRAGYLSFGLSRGGAADPVALAEGAALLGQSPDCAALEMAGMGGRFEASNDIRIALTGAPMRAAIEGEALRWNASHTLPKGAKLDIGPVTSGSYGYLHLGGGIDTAPALGARAAHLTAGLGKAIEAGDTLPLGADKGSDTGLCLPADDRFDGGAVRVLPSLQTQLFPQQQRDRFADTQFTRDARANRMGVQVTCDGPGFEVEGGLSVVSEIIVPGDIQITGDGTPFVLMAECQTTGGYPRIGTVIPADLPRVAQAPAGAKLRFRFITLDEGVALHRTHLQRLADLPKALTPLIRDPARMRDLLSYQLISGATAGRELDRKDTE
ncbi:biotin-dependent carboxyltransferase family protein [Thalassococcus sp. BH17M4-6]|uniref:5-oxoprolinase subunit C family protein n=1 Tax=Thalassococcus sp. BH17M4-6 TaxID=3413148 RepID=UPI003BE548FE